MMNPIKPFRNRTHAGKQLAQALWPLAGTDAIVLALPRGGVPVGFAVARALELPLDILLVRKLGLPGHEEFAMGAVGSGGVRVLNPEAERAFRIPPQLIDAACERELQLIAARERRFRGARPLPSLRGRAVILVDDGLATGSTMRAAIEVARAAGPSAIVAAVPVGAPDTCDALEPEVDQLVCLVRPPAFRAVSQWYRHFEQTTDAEVQDLLTQAWNDSGVHHAPVHPE